MVDTSISLPNCSPMVGDMVAKTTALITAAISNRAGTGMP